MALDFFTPFPFQPHKTEVVVNRIREIFRVYYLYIAIR